MGGKGASSVKKGMGLPGKRNRRQRKNPLPKKVQSKTTTAAKRKQTANKLRTSSKRKEVRLCTLSLLHLQIKRWD